MDSSATATAWHGQGRRESGGGGGGVPGKKKRFYAQRSPKILQLINIRQLINGVGFTHRSIFLHYLLLKVLLIIVPKTSLIESRQCNGKRVKTKQRKDGGWKGKKKPRGAPFFETSLGAPEKYPLLPPPSRWACACGRLYKLEDVQITMTTVVPLWAKSGLRSNLRAFNFPGGAYPRPL